MQPDDKLNIDSLTLDNVIGGDGVEVEQDATDVLDKAPQEVEEVTDEISAEPDDRGDEDADDDEYQHEQEDQNYIEDEADEDVEAESGSVAFEVAKTLGFELDGDYEDSVEGLTNFVKDVTQNAAEGTIGRSYSSSFPEVQQHLDYVLAGGESREFFQRQGQQIDYNSIQVEEGDVNMQRAILAQFLQTKGHDTEFIQDTIDTYEDSGKLYNNAEKAKGHLASLSKRGARTNDGSTA